MRAANSAAPGAPSGHGREAAGSPASVVATPAIHAVAHEAATAHACAAPGALRRIRLRLLAHLSNDEHLVAAFCSGADFHAATASRVFGLPVEDVSPELRSRAKAVNFGIVYGQQAFGLSQSLGIPFGEAKEMIER